MSKPADATTTTASLNAAPMRYLDQALDTLHALGLAGDAGNSAADPMIPLLNRIAGFDEARVTVIARTLTQAGTFNQVVREQVQAMDIGSRYERITEAFNSIRDDARRMVDQLADGKIDTMERMSNLWMKITRGDIAGRFDKIKETYLEVAASTQDQVQREQLILQAYQDFRVAMKQSEVLALEVLQTAEGALAEARAAVDQAMQAVTDASGAEAADRARLELARDQRVRDLQDVEKRYQIAKDLADNLTVSYHTSEVVMARLLQTTNAKERLYQQAISFFTTNETVLTALTASFTGMFGLAETTKTVEAMKDGISQSLEALADLGGQVQEAAIRTGYGPTVRAEAVKQLVESVVSYQTHSREIIEEMRVASTRNAEEIREAVEDGKRRMARLAAQGQGLVADARP
ncbi:MAG: cell surface protein [Chromatiaceae bacterium]|nr:MAG: cell surface protein [Chromatiaceae bacterium]